jgi:hypothetical protein
MSSSDQLDQPVYSVRKLTQAEFDALHAREMEDDEPRGDNEQPHWNPLG